MKTGITHLTNKAILTLVLSLASTVAYSASEIALSPVEKKTVNFMNNIANNGNIQVNIQNLKHLEKDSQYLSSNQQEDTIANIGSHHKEAIINNVTKQFFRGFLGGYEQKLKTKVLALDLADDEAPESNIAVKSYDKNNFELTMKARKNKEQVASEQGVAASDVKEIKGKWKVNPRIANPGVHVGYLASKFNLEMRLTTAEQTVNFHRKLKDIAVDVFYNVDLKNHQSSLTVSRSLVKSVNLQVQSIGQGINAFGNSEERVSFNFGKVF